MYFFVRDDNALDKYKKICDKINESLNIKFHNKLVYNQKYLKAKVREFDNVVKTFQVMKCQKKICIILALFA